MQIDCLTNYSLYCNLEGKDEFYFSESHDNKSNSYNVLNLRLAYQRENIEFSVWANNVLDDEYGTRGFGFGNDPRDNYTSKSYTQKGAPRTFGISASYGF